MPRPGIKRAAEPDSVIEATPCGGVDLSFLQRRARPVCRARRSRGAGARPSGRGDRHHRAVPADQRHPERSRRRPPGLRGGGRSPQHRLVGGLRDARLVHQPLRGAWRRGSAVLLVGLGRGTRLREGRRGGDARRVRARRVALGGAEHPLRRGAVGVSRLRPRFLPAGAGRGPQGAARPTSAPSTIARSRWCPIRRSGPRRT